MKTYGYLGILYTIQRRGFSMGKGNLTVARLKREKVDHCGDGMYGLVWYRVDGDIKKGTQ